MPTPDEVMMVTKPLTPQLISKHGRRMHLTFSKAKQMQKDGHVKILHRLDEMSNTRKYVEKHKHTIQRRVDTGEFQGIKIYPMMPFLPDKQIGKAYNDAMENMVEEWALFIDHDVLLINPLWYDISIKAIQKVGSNAGWITCYTNRIGCKFQLAPNLKGFENIRKTDDIKVHRRYAKKLYDVNRGRIKDMTRAGGGRFSGMFILTNKSAWAAAGGFVENAGFFNVDCKYYSSIKEAGYSVYVMQDLYVYHAYFREVLKPYFSNKEEG
jgi:hypothetical protein